MVSVMLRRAMTLTMEMAVVITVVMAASEMVASEPAAEE